MPNLVAKAAFMIRVRNWVILEELYKNIQIAENKMIDEAIDWIKKYLMEDSPEFFASFAEFIIGIKDKILSSRPNHILKNEDEETTIMVLATKKNA